jgi:hypothetical protein
MESLSGLLFPVKSKALLEKVKLGYMFSVASPRFWPRLELLNLYKELDAV